MADLLDDSDSDHTLNSVESDEETNLPSYAGLIASPPKKIKNEPVRLLPNYFFKGY